MVNKMDQELEEKLKAVIELCEEGDPEMCAFLGKEFYYGWNIPQDLDRALRYLTVASESGDAISQFTLGFMYWSGRGTEPDLDQAYKWFLCAAEQDVPEAMYNVAKILLTKDFEKNKDEAMGWLRRSANAGYDAAYDMLSDLKRE
jgi:TPR repeat protein